jgi:hypothetical protein
MAQPKLPLDLVDLILSTLSEVRRRRPDLPFKSPGGTSSVRHLSVSLLQARYGAPINTWSTRLGSIRGAYLAAWTRAEAGQYTPGEVGARSAEPVPEIPAADLAEAAAPRTLAEDVKLHRAQATSEAARVRLKEALGEISRLEAELADYRWARGARIAPPEWTVKRQVGDKHAHIPVLITSDFQIGEVIRPQETDHTHGYSVEIFRRRYRALIAQTIRLCLDHQPSWTYPGIIYERLGDTISGGIHDELAETDEVTPIEAVQIAAEEETAGIRALAEAFGRVLVQDCGGGNHDRDTHKPRSKAATAHSYDRLVSYILQREFKDDPRVEIFTTESPDIVFRVYDRTILATHGDKIGSRGGQGFIGPSATIARGAQKVIMDRRGPPGPLPHLHRPGFRDQQRLPAGVQRVRQAEPPAPPAAPAGAGLLQPDLGPGLHQAGVSGGVTSFTRLNKVKDLRPPFSGVFCVQGIENAGEQSD